MVSEEGREREREREGKREPFRVRKECNETRALQVMKPYQG